MSAAAKSYRALDDTAEGSSIPPLPRCASRARPRNAAGEGPPTKHTLTAICFDLDGVLINTMPFHAQAWQEALKEWGLQVAPQEIYAWEGEPGFVTARKLLRRRKGRRCTPFEARRLLQDKERRFARLARRARVERPWLELLRTLKQRNRRLGLVTGTSRQEVRRVVSPAVLRCFDVIITGDAVRRGKPHPEPYRRSCARLHVDPRQAIVIENSPYGIRSARRAQVACVIGLASSLPPTYLCEADLVVQTASQLRSLLKRL